MWFTLAQWTAAPSQARNSYTEPFLVSLFCLQKERCQLLGIIRRLSPFFCVKLLYLTTRINFYSSTKALSKLSWMQKLCACCCRVPEGKHIKTSSLAGSHTPPCTGQGTASHGTRWLWPRPCVQNTDLGSVNSLTCKQCLEVGLL